MAHAWPRIEYYRRPANDFEPAWPNTTIDNLTITESSEWAFDVRGNPCPPKSN